MTNPTAPTKADIAAAERVIKRAVAKAVARLRDAGVDTDLATKENVCTFIAAIDIADLLVGGDAA